MKMINYRVTWKLTRCRHIHLQQDEYFQVEQGVLGAITDGKEHAITKEDGVLKSPAGTR
jgi:uncharacterized cupin superfamily protein